MIRLSRCAARFRNTSPKCVRNCAYSVLRLHLGMKMTWYLQSHAVWLKLWYSSIGFLLFVCLAAHVLEFLRWTPGSVKLLLPPRQSRGASYVRLANKSAKKADPTKANSTIALPRSARPVLRTGFVVRIKKLPPKQIFVLILFSTNQGITLACRANQP